MNFPVKIDPDMVLPMVRSSIEKYIDFIAAGKSDFQTVVTHSLQVFEEKFKYFVEKVGRRKKKFFFDYFMFSWEEKFFFFIFVVFFYDYYLFQNSDFSFHIFQKILK